MSRSASGTSRAIGIALRLALRSAPRVPRSASTFTPLLTGVSVAVMYSAPLLGVAWSRCAGRFRTGHAESRSTDSGGIRSNRESGNFANATMARRATRSPQLPPVCARKTPPSGPARERLRSAPNQGLLPTWLFTVAKASRSATNAVMAKIWSSPNPDRRSVSTSSLVMALRIPCDASRPVGEGLLVLLKAIRSLSFAADDGGRQFGTRRLGKLLPPGK